MYRQILPIKHLVVLLQFTAPSTPRFFHQTPVTAFLRHLSDNNPDYEKYLCIDTPESGRLNYQEGDYYRFSIFGFQGCDTLLQYLIEKLQQLPLSVKKTDKALAFKDNLKLISLQDGFTTLPIQSVEQLSEYTERQLGEEVNLWQDVLKKQPVLSLRWLSPARLKKQKTVLKKEARYCHDQHDLSLELLLQRLHSGPSTFIRQKSIQKVIWELPPLPDVCFKQNHCYWVDNAYYNNQAKAKPIGGMLGLQVLEFKQPVSEAWLQILILGQYLGVGERRIFGLGRYVLELPSGESTYKRVFPAQPLPSEKNPG